MLNRSSFYKMVVATLAGGAIGALATTLAATQEGVSISGWLIARLAPILAPDLESPKGVRRAVEHDRARGPGKPSAYWLRKGVFSDEGSGQSRRYRFRIHNGETGGLRLLYLHGGGYVLDLHPAQWALAGGLLERVGGEVVVPLYPLAPEHGWREGLEAAKQAYLALLAENRSDPIVLVGDSAGGGLALVLAQTLRDSGEPQPAAIVLFSPALDLSNHEAKPESAAHAREFRYEGGRLWAKGLAANDPRLSPLYGDNSNLPPTLVFSGTRDPLDVDAVRLKRVNPELVLRRYPGMMHVWPMAPIPEGRRALDEAAEFIGQHTPAAARTNRRRPLP
jgi:acetyl esterase/lipase